MDAHPAAPRQWQAAKITPPSLPALVSRARPLALIDQAMAAFGCAILHAPGGSGKSCLARDWTARQPEPLAWYNLDPADNDPHYFMSGLVAAVLAALGDPPLPANLRAYPPITQLSLLLFHLEPTPLILALNNAQCIEDATTAGRLLNRIVAVPSLRFRRLLLSRPGLHLDQEQRARLWPSAVVGAHDLAWTAHDAPQLLAAHGLNEAHAAAALRHTGGWATGLLLLAAAPHLDGARGVDTQIISDQAAEHLLRPLSDDLLIFLGESALLGGATIDETNHLLGRSDSAAAYAAVLQTTLLCQAHGDAFRYHDLFADILTRRIEREQPARAAHIRVAAAGRWAGQGDYARACECLAAGRLWPALIALLGHAETTLVRPEYSQTVLRALNALPPGEAPLSLTPLAVTARMYGGHYAEAITIGARALRAPGHPAWLRLAALHAHCHVALGLAREALTLANAALTWAEAQPTPPERADLASLRHARGAALLSLERLDDSRADLEAALLLVEDGDERRAWLAIALHLGAALGECGETHRLTTLIEQARDRQRRADLPIHQTPLPLLLITERRLLGDHAEARRLAEETIVFHRAHQAPHALLEALGLLVETVAEADRPATAEALIHETMRLHRDSAVRGLSPQAQRARLLLALRHDDLAGALTVIASLDGLPAQPEETSPALDLLIAFTAFAAHPAARHLSILRGAAERLVAGHHYPWAGRAYLLLAQAALQVGKINQAAAALAAMSEQVVPRGCGGFLAPYWPLAPLVGARWPLIAHLPVATRALLQTLTPGHHQGAGRGGDQEEALVIDPFTAHPLRLPGAVLPSRTLGRKSIELCCYLAHHRRPVTRAELLREIHDHAPGAAAALNAAARRLGHALGPRYWGQERDSYFLLEPYHDQEAVVLAHCRRAVGTDASLLERDAAAAALVRHLARPRYLAACDSLWAEAVRVQLAARIHAALLAVAALNQDLGRLDQAVTLWRAAIAHDPLDERPRRGLARALSLSGDRDQAMRELGRYRRLARRELGLLVEAGLDRFIAAG